MENSNNTNAHDSTESADAQIVSEALPILNPSNWVKKPGAGSDRLYTAPNGHTFTAGLDKQGIWAVAHRNVIHRLDSYTTLEALLKGETEFFTTKAAEADALGPASPEGASAANHTKPSIYDPAAWKVVEGVEDRVFRTERGDTITAWAPRPGKPHWIIQHLQPEQTGIKAGRRYGRGKDYGTFDALLEGQRDQLRRIEAEAAGPSLDELWKQCEVIARNPRILDYMAGELERTGRVGEGRAAKMVYMTVTSRILDKPICGIMKAQASTGKSYTVDGVLKFFPETAYCQRTTLSPASLAYGEEPLCHRIIVLAEAAGLSEGRGSYLMRSLISEGELQHETVQADADGKQRSVVLRRQGPTGFLCTTTAVALENELETRMFSIPLTDSKEQTANVLRSIAAGAAGKRRKADPIDWVSWHALQLWIEKQSCEVVIPFAPAIAERMPAVSVRLRRDFDALIRLIQIHAILHQASRKRDVGGAIVATPDDYAACYELVADLVAAGVGASVSKELRETVGAVQVLVSTAGGSKITLPKLAAALNRDKSTVSRRVAQACALGFLINEEERPRMPANILLGDALPDEQEILPKPQDIDWRDEEPLAP